METLGRMFLEHRQRQETEPGTNLIKQRNWSQAPCIINSQSWDRMNGQLAVCNLLTFVTAQEKGALVR